MAEASHRCRMVTKSGERCSRSAVPGGMGFCWQHVPVEKKEDREKWKLRIEGAALAVATTDVLIKITQLAVEHLHEFFGPGDDQTRAKKQIAMDFPPFWPTSPKEYTPGARVDWKTLLRLFQDAKRAAANPQLAEQGDFEQRFGKWFDNLNEYHKGELLAAIAEDSE